MKLRFGQIEEVLQVVHRVHESDRSRFRAKLRNLPRVGLSMPGGGSGRRANYNPADLFKFAVAVELVQAGLSPEATAATVNQHWPDAVEALFATRKGGQTEYLVANPRLMTDDLYVRLRRADLKAITALIEVGGSTRSLVLNLTALLVRVRQAAEQVGLDMVTLEAELDQDQHVILTQGARIYGHS